MKDHSDAINSVCYSRDGNYLATGSNDKCIYLYTTANDSYSLAHKLTGHDGDINSVAFAHGRLLFSGSGDSTIKVWDAQDGRCINTTRHHSNWVRSIAISSNSSFLVSGGYDDTVRVTMI